MSQKILVAIDDSENAMRAVEFIAKSFTREHRITLFSVVLDTPAICDMDNPSLIPYFMAQKAAFCSVEDKKKAFVMEALQKAKELLLKAGYEEGNIAIKVSDKEKGVARGIVHEADSGYDTIILGRRGLSGLKEFFLGSVSQKVLQSAKAVSVVLVN
jgi:nucleotide-binding universal stress UspA family protein